MFWPAHMVLGTNLVDLAQQMIVADFLPETPEASSFVVD